MPVERSNERSPRCASVLSPERAWWRPARKIEVANVVHMLAPTSSKLPTRGWRSPKRPNLAAESSYS
jgi:hypothetical protein